MCMLPATRILVTGKYLPFRVQVKVTPYHGLIEAQTYTCPVAWWGVTLGATRSRRAQRAKTHSESVINNYGSQRCKELSEGPQVSRRMEGSVGTHVHGE